MSKRPGCRVLDRKVRQNKPASQHHKENKDSEANFSTEKNKKAFNNCPLVLSTFIFLATSMAYFLFYAGFKLLIMYVYV